MKKILCIEEVVGKTTHDNILEEIKVESKSYDSLCLFYDTNNEFPSLRFSDWLIKNKGEEKLLNIISSTPTIKKLMKSNKNLMSGSVIFDSKYASDELDYLRDRSMKELVFVIYRATPKSHRPMLEYGNLYKGQYFNMSAKIIEDLEDYVERIETNSAEGIITLMPNSKYTLEEFTTAVNDWVK